MEFAYRWLAQSLGLKEGETPFKWQLRLLEDLRAGRRPSALDIPTGLGKTAVMAIWLVGRALGAPLPRRLIYVVDRRAVVDQATEVALNIRAFVDRAQDVRERLGLGVRSLAVSTLRGQFVDNREWLEDPAAPAIIVGTVDMIGSRVLFSGYGVSRKMRPYHAGLLGADALVVLDEAHLVPPFEALLRDIENRADLFRQEEDTKRQVSVPPFRLMSLSATGRKGSAKSPFRLLPEDLTEPLVEKRLAAGKRLALRQMNRDENLADVLADKAWELTGGGRSPVRCIVFCDKREDAARVKVGIDQRARPDGKAGRAGVEISSELFVGARRVREREDAAGCLKKLGFIAGKTVERRTAAFLFATSAAEVGVDLDADCMVCDLVRWERMVQRLGRVNRRGDVLGGADICVVLEAEVQPDKRTQEALRIEPEERDSKEIKRVEKHNEEVALNKALRKPLEFLPWSGGFADASTGAIRELNERADKDGAIRAALEDATTPAPLRPALTNAVVGAWATTSLESHPGRPDVEPWIRGWVKEDPPQTEVVWRMHLPVMAGEFVDAGKVKNFFEAAPVHMSEVLETDTFRLVKWLAARGRALQGASELPAKPDAACKPLEKDDVVGVVFGNSGNYVRKLLLKDLDSMGDGRRGLDEVLRNARVILKHSVAGLRDGLLEDTTKESPRTADDGEPWTSEPSGADKGAPMIRFRVRVEDGGRGGVRNRTWLERFRFAVELSGDGVPVRSLVVEKWRDDSANEDDRSEGREQLVDEHRDWVKERVGTLARSLPLPEAYREMLEVAAFLHDEGKRASRWQRAFNARPGKDAWAKTEGPINYSLLDGYRHEFGSVISVGSHERLLNLPDDLRELAMHLIASHHGFARPFIGTRGCDEAPPSALQQHARGVALRFEKLQRKWGPWGLAWWESLLRAADQQASRDNDERNGGEAAVAGVV